MFKLLQGTLCLLFLGVVWSFPKTALAQFEVHPDSSFYTLTDSFYHYYQEDSAEGGIYNRVRRDVMTWQARLAPDGKMRKATQALTHYAEEYNNRYKAGASTIPVAPATWTDLGPFDVPSGVGQIQRMAFHPHYNGTTNQIMYAGSHQGGLYRSDDGGQSWYNYHTDRGLPSTSIAGIALSANTLVVCTGNGDFGYDQFGLNANYSTLGPGSINDYNPIHTVGVYKYSPAHPNKWVDINGVGNNSVTMIGGATKNGLLDAFAEGGTMRQIIMHPTNDNILFIATSLGIFRTVDGGSTWEQVLNYQNATDWRGLAFHPTNPDIVYASARGIFMSVNGGDSWQILANEQNLPAGFNAGLSISRTTIKTTAAAPHLLYAMCIGRDNSIPRNRVDLVVYNQVTDSWMTLKTVLQSTLHGGPHPGEDYQPQFAALAVSPFDSNKVYIGGTKVYGSNLAFNPSSWEYKSPYFWWNEFHPDVHDLQFPPHTDSIIYAATHGGVHVRATDTSSIRTWSNLSSGLGVSTIWAFDDWEGDAGVFIQAHQDNGIIASDDRGAHWDWRFGGDGYGARIDDQSGWAFFKGNSDTSFFRLPRFNNSWGGFYREGYLLPPLVNGSGERTHNAFPMINHPKTDSLYFGFNGIHCRLAVDPVGSARPIWKHSSDLTHYYNDSWHRRVMDIAISEDEQHDVTYLSTLGDIRSGRRNDFYVAADNTKNVFGTDTVYLMKTQNIPRTNPLPNANPNPTTGIAIDPLNGSRVWISLSGYDPAFKVLYSDDQGDTWTSYDDANGTLAKLNMPINNIVYQRGTKDRLYIGTDVGVYVREGEGLWRRYGEDFPNVRVTELKINYCVGKLRVATYGRGQWEADLMPTESSTAYRSFRTISSDETWTSNKNLSRDIKVKAGATLHLQKMTLNMPKDGLIVVEPGGQLFVDSTTITNLCGQTWQGIEVWGNTNLEQYPTTNQGELLVINSIIEHAKEAVSPWQVGNFPKPDGTGGTGGIVRAAGSQFKNNWRSVGFMQYHAPSGTAREASRFIDCTFEVNDDLRQDFLGHVSAWDINQLRIEGCQFKDQRTNKIGDGYGIFTLSASIHLTAQAPSPGNPTFERNSFEGLSRGIVLGSTPNKGSTVVDQTDFTNINRGVIVRASGGLKVLRNTFEIGGYDNSFTAANPYGLSILRQGDFIAEQNDFQGSATMPSGRVSLGFWVDDLGSGFNEIRSNTFTSLDIANLAHGNSGGDANNFFGGLQYLCNGQTGNAFDITINKAFRASTGAVIATNQGNNAQPAYNSFSHPLSSSYGIDWHMSNDASILPKVNYWLPFTPLANEIPSDNVNIDLLSSNSNGNPAFCDLNYTNLGYFKPLGNNGEVATLSNLKTEYYQSWASYQQLVQDYENDPTSTTLPAAVGIKGQELTSKANEVLFYYRNDTTGIDCDSIAVWIQHKVGLSAQYELVEHYWGCGQRTAALAHLATIADNYTLTGLMLDNHQDYETLLNLLSTAYDEARTEATLNKDEVIVLNELAENNYGFAAMKAANIVDFFYSDTYRYHPTLPEGGEKRGQNPITKVEKGNLVIYPNPTTTWADVSYRLPENSTKGRIVVTSTAGQQVVTLPIKENQGILTLNTSQWLTGTYFVVLYAEEEGKLGEYGRVIEQTQLIIR